MTELNIIAEAFVPLQANQIVIQIRLRGKKLELVSHWMLVCNYPSKGSSVANLLNILRS